MESFSDIIIRGNIHGWTYRAYQSILVVGFNSYCDFNRLVQLLMDFFDILYVASETYCETKKDMDRNNDYIEVAAMNFMKSKNKIDKLCDKEMRDYNKKRKKEWQLLD